MTLPDCQVLRLGLQPYREVRALQESLAAQIAVGQVPPSLLLLEHPHTYTFGRRGKASNLLWDEATLRQRGVEVHWIDRGGDVTYHGPGQLVGYPLLPLGRLEAAGHLPQADYVGYLRRLEEVLIRALASLGLASAQLPAPPGSGFNRMWPLAAHTARRPPACGPPRSPPLASGWMRAASAGMGSPSTCIRT